MPSMLAVRAMATAAARRRFAFVRHGEAEHNPFVTKGKAEGDEDLLRRGRSILNPHLTPKGQHQAAQLRESLRGTAFDIVVTTPLARAVETAWIAFGESQAAFIVTPECTESAEPRLGGPQRGLSKEGMLREHAFLSSGGRWDLSLIKEGVNWIQGDADVLGGVGWYNPQPVSERLPAFKQWLHTLPQGKRICAWAGRCFPSIVHQVALRAQHPLRSSPQASSGTVACSTSSSAFRWRIASWWSTTSNCRELRTVGLADAMQSASLATPECVVNVRGTAPRA